MTMAGKTWAPVLLLFVLLPGNAWSQQYSYRLYGGAGVGRYYDDEGSLGRAVSYRGGAEWRPLRRLGLAGEIAGVHHTRSDYFNVRGNALSISGNALLYFSRSRVQPYLLGGLGLLRTNYSYGWPNIGTFHRNANEAALHLGGGVRLFLNRRWSLDPEVRVAVSYPSAFSFVNYFSMSLSRHW